MESDSEREKSFAKLRADIKAANFHRMFHTADLHKAVTESHMEDKMSHDPMYSNSKKNKGGKK